MCRCTCLPPSLFYEIVSYLAKAPKGTVFGARTLGTFLTPQMSDAYKRHACTHTGHKGMPCILARAAGMCMNVPYAHRIWAYRMKDIDQFRKKPGRVSLMETRPALAMAKARMQMRKKERQSKREIEWGTYLTNATLDEHLTLSVPKQRPWRLQAA